MITKLLSFVMLCGVCAAETNHFPHYAYSGMMYEGTNYVWSYREAPHRVRWHDGYDGPELVRLELRTNTVPWGVNSWNHDELFRNVRILRIVTPTLTNEVELETVGVESRKVAQPTLAESMQRLVKLLDRQDRILDELQQHLSTLTNMPIVRFRTNSASGSMRR